MAGIIDHEVCHEYDMLRPRQNLIISTYQIIWISWEVTQFSLLGSRGCCTTHYLFKRSQTSRQFFLETNKQMMIWVLHVNFGKQIDARMYFCTLYSNYKTNKLRKKIYNPSTFGHPISLPQPSHHDPVALWVRVRLGAVLAQAG